jgi:hypothetical protein
VSAQEGDEDAGLSETVHETGRLRAHQGLRHGERTGDQAGHPEGSGLGMDQPDDTEAGHSHPDPGRSRGQEEGRRAGGLEG